MKRCLIGILFLLLFQVSNANAQSITTTTCPGAGCQDINVGGQGSIGVQITGTWVGTITFQGSVGTSSSSTFVSVLVTPSTSSVPVSTTTGNGVWTASIAGLNQIRVVFTSWMSGTATVTFRVTNQARSGSGGTGGGGSGSVTSVDLAVPGGFTSSGGPITTTGTLTLGVPTDPNSDRIWFWDDSANAFAYLTAGTGLNISGTTITASGGGAAAGSDTEIQFNDATNFGADSSFTYDKTLDVLTVAPTHSTASNPSFAINASNTSTRTTGNETQTAVRGFSNTTGTGNYSGLLIGLLGFVANDGTNSMQGPPMYGIRADGNYLAATAKSEASYGVYIGSNLTDGDLTSNYGLYIADQSGMGISGSSGGWAIKTGLGLVDFGDQMILGSTGGTSGTPLLLGGASSPSTGKFNFSSVNEMDNLTNGIAVSAVDNNGSGASQFNGAFIYAQTTHAMADGTLGYVRALNAVAQSSTADGLTSNVIAGEFLAENSGAAATNVIGVNIKTPQTGVMSTTDTIIGLNIEDQTGSGMAASSTYALKTGVGIVEFNDATSVTGTFDVYFADQMLNGHAYFDKAITLQSSDGDTNNGSDIILNTGSAFAMSGGRGGDVEITTGSGDGAGNAGDFTANFYDLLFTAEHNVEFDTDSGGAIILSPNSTPGVKFTVSEALGFYFENASINGYEMTAPAAPAANGFKIYAVDVAGKTNLCALFASGAAQCFAAQP